MCSCLGSIELAFIVQRGLREKSRLPRPPQTPWTMSASRLTDTPSGRRQPPAAGGERFIASTAWKLRVGSVLSKCGRFQSSRQPLIRKDR